MVEQQNPEASLTIKEFCALENISLATYHKIRNKGHGPRETRVPGMAIVRITLEARREWHERLKRLSDSAEVAKDRRALSVHGKRAGRAAAASPRHIARRKAAAARVEA